MAVAVAVAGRCRQPGRGFPVQSREAEGRAARPRCLGGPRFGPGLRSLRGVHGQACGGFAGARRGGLDAAPHTRPRPVSMPLTADLRGGSGGGEASAGPGHRAEREASDRVTGRPGTAGWEPCPSAGRSPAGADAAWRGLSLVSEAYLSGDPVCQALGRRWDTHALHGGSAARGLRLCFQPWGNRGQGGPEKGERGRFPLQSPWPRTHTWAGVG